VVVPEEAPDPVPGPSHVPIDIEISNITFVETQVPRAGNPAMLPSLPAILGNGAGGVVTGIGAGLDPDLIGRRVVASLHGTDGYAQRVVADSVALTDIPSALTTAGRTATTAILTALLSSIRQLTTAAAHKPCSTATIFGISRTEKGFPLEPPF
jgi:NADPH2:quinone reductase